MKTFFNNLGYRVRDYFRDLLGINTDVRDIAADMNNLGASLNKVGQDVFELFHTLPFSIGILNLKASDAAKFVNPNVGQQNLLIPVLTGIVMQCRMGQSSLQIQGTLSDDVRGELLKRGFKVEDLTGSNDNTGTFVLWT